MDQEGAVDDRSEGFFRIPTPPPKKNSGMTGVTQTRQALAHKCPRNGRSRPRIVETSDKLYFIIVCIVICIEENQNCLRVCFRGCHYCHWRLGFVVTWYISFSIEETYDRYDHKGHPEIATVNSVLLQSMSFNSISYEVLPFPS
jgi:hypothetical protein